MRLRSLKDSLAIIPDFELRAYMPGAVCRGIYYADKCALPVDDNMVHEPLVLPEAQYVHISDCM